MSSWCGEPAAITLDFPPLKASSSLTNKLHNTSLSRAKYLSLTKTLFRSNLCTTGSLRQDQNFIMQMVEKNSYILGHAYANGKRYIHNLYRNTPENYGIEQTVNQQQEDESKERALKLIEEYCVNYVKLSETLKNDIDICLACLRNNGFYYVFQNSQNSQNKELIERAVREISELTFFMQSIVIKL
ncbi:predicted protein [Naegleria gruberi]|uniref:Predicted protein n=1 Tax=Naegleria gruberi TaxID=5762 RepID=D2VVE3_NAEGR|nr:uncharacterized protein NAEGRDRAFT_72986 [Naegleria gruberi]EFC39218.1 predicted protein [Naegleria gruberi]|eukprot:XP_002671962.1 predicted protein [Naegleria gruberi strain NEG-M]